MACAMRWMPMTAESQRGGAPRPAGADAVLGIEQLAVRYASAEGEVAAVSDFSLGVAAGECVGVVGESGAGKSQAFLAAMGLLGRAARVSGRVRLEGADLLGARAATLDMLRGARIAMIFQDSMTSLTPHLTIGEQIGESLVRHRGLSARAARVRALALLESVHIGDAARCLAQYPHELSGGMRQRVMIAIALACDPVMLIADEPTTALDVTIQAQILALLAELKRARQLSLVLISHDLGVIASIADRVVVMYGGRIIEHGGVRAVLQSPAHPYTAGLLASMPRMDVPAGSPLAAIRGQPPDPRRLPPGCAFQPRCDFASALCVSVRPPLAAGPRTTRACHHALDGVHA
ncbi:MAG TPA: ABC transporter ATP-binding protein [Steroidobacteraceae bacterium]